LRPDALDDIGADWSTPQALPLRSGACEASVDPAADHRALELRECAGDLVEQPACRGRGVDVLLIEVEQEYGSSSR
jgi:hypothetical protein